MKVNDDYETPGPLFDSGCQVANFKPLLDVCATEKNTKCEKFISKKQNALTKEWLVDCFMNPPYSEIAKFVEKAFIEHKVNDIKILSLMYARTDTVWWHRFIEGKSQVYFIRGRVRFQKNGKNAKHTAPYPSCWVIWQ